MANFRDLFAKLQGERPDPEDSLADLPLDPAPESEGDDSVHALTEGSTGKEDADG
jgi:hypothetical protein